MSALLNLFRPNLSTAVFWEGEVFMHTSRSLRDALDWAAQYPDGVLVSIHKGGRRAPLTQFRKGS
ncbi:hypothetical protein HOR51_gp06 [Ralstonia phage phiAp1]|uniref:Uncharacterized protein n=1 Tax=Ralstonia phage phiAp1 TaxID=2783867 RepID=A0A1L7DS24_9CAUD|nr:hypothetical protein HOR51_gp06 [Ralstonia phage phiAp1]APU03147.1 hypothetical protein phiAp1_06 [Ralstonia phage phiAp1]